MTRKIFGKTLRSGSEKKEATVKFTHTAWFDCIEGEILHDVAADLVTEAADYILKKKEQERFTIASAELNTVITGLIIYKDQYEMELLITNAYNDVYFVSNSDVSDVHRVD